MPTLLIKVSHDNLFNRLYLELSQLVRWRFHQLMLQLVGFQETTVDNVHEALQQSLTAEPLLLDVRTPQEYRSGHAVKAVNIELDALSEAVRAGTLDDWKEEGPILVICQSGKRSAQATVRLSKVFDFQQVINVKGGTSAWIAAGYPTEQGDGMTMDAPPHLL